MTEKAEILWKEWLITSQYKPIVNIENHDTIGLLALLMKKEIYPAHVPHLEWHGSYMEG